MAYQPRHAALQADAGNRAVRTLLVGLVIDVVLAVIIVVAPIVSSANGFGDFEWQAIAFLVVKTALMTGGAFILRRFVDPSRIPTPLPPEFPGEPADDEVAA